MVVPNRSQIMYKVSTTLLESDKPMPKYGCEKTTPLSWTRLLSCPLKLLDFLKGNMFRKNIVLNKKKGDRKARGLWTQIVVVTHVS